MGFVGLFFVNNAPETTLTATSSNATSSSKTKTATHPLQCGNVFKIYTPNEGEIFSANKTIDINYFIPENIAQNLKQNDVVELYLLDKEGQLTGYIDQVTPTSTNYQFDQGKLRHDGGLDFSIAGPKAGDYKIALLVREKSGHGHTVGTWDRFPSDYIQSTGKLAHCALSSQFKIVFETPKTLKVTSPNGGEKFNIGDTVTITWEISPRPRNSDYVHISVNNYTIGEALAVNGKYEWKIKPDYWYAQFKDYKVEIGYRSPTDYLKDSSDKAFIIK